MSFVHEKGLHVLRSLYRELRPSVREPNKHVYQTQGWKYIVKICRQNPPTNIETTDPNNNNNPQSQELLIRVGEYYSNAIKGTREYLTPHTLYKGKGERSPQDLAEILGFKMPDDETPDPRRRKLNNDTNLDSKKP